MKSRFQLKLTWSLLLFAMLISIILATTDHHRMRHQAFDNTLTQIQLNEKMVQYALESIDKAYYLFGENVAARMKKTSDVLLQKYDDLPSLDEWDFDQLKEQLQFDIYMIDEYNKIQYSSLARDIGLDFAVCCGKLAKVLDERRATGKFYHDGIDIEQGTGMLKKYSYVATKDKKYIIQLSYFLEDSAIFRVFNFLDTIDDLKRNNPSIDEINILNIGGLPLRKSPSDEQLSGDRRKAFEQTLRTGKTTEFRGKRNGESAIFRYVQYESKYDVGTTKHKVLEIIYNDRELKKVLNENLEVFLIQLIAILIIAAGLSLVITRWAAKPMHMAFHDSLTGLKNRAAFDELLASALADNKGTLALLMIDLDNFKFVNDRLGHSKGDHLLRSVAHGIRSAAGDADMTIRLGGDEFVIVMPATTREAVEDMAIRVLNAVRDSIDNETDSLDEEVTVSIGIALAPEHGMDPETLCRNADAALYRSKEKGKNRYGFYE
ncbi:GGDEF domain-containing protein [Cohnella terricola]|nr:GGDEF domain-containing protein [Cohnella terricola]